MLETQTRKFETFVVPPSQPIAEKYTYRTEKIDNGKGYWSYSKVTIELHNEDGTTEDIFDYVRKYSAFYKTFEPFRQLKDGVWKDYALISSSYTRFEVVDLEARKIIAVEPYPTITEKDHERWKAQGREDLCEKEPVGKELPGSGFCPVEFMVPEWADHFSQDSVDTKYSRQGKEETYMYDEDEFLQYTGQFALYLGCIWGDDSGGWKLRYIDLSQISEGIVSSDERFGYIHFSGKSLKEDIEFWEDGRIVLPVQLYSDLKTGKSYPIEANWSKD